MLSSSVEHDVKSIIAITINATKNLFKVVIGVRFLIINYGAKIH
jgi:hypothetical protein